MRKNVCILIVFGFFLFLLVGCKTTSIISFDCMGGEFSDGTSTKNLVVGGDLALPTAPTKTGYTFVGWYSDLEYQETFDITNSVEENIIVYAKWNAVEASIEEVIISFDSNGGIGDMESIASDIESDIVLPENTYTKTNYNFIGWATTSSGNVQYLDEDTIVDVENDITLYAIWEGGDINITLDYTFFEVEVVAKFNDTYSSILNTATSNGYTFDGWTLDLEEPVFNINTTLIDNINSHRVYAIWTAKEFDVNFDTDGGSSVLPIEVTYDDLYGVLPTTVKTGYTFDGWYTALTEGDKISSNSTVKQASDHTLYARWLPTPYTVTFDSNGGEEIDDLTVYYNAPYGILPIAEKQGYTFMGWYTALIEGTLIEATTVFDLTENQELFAHWEIETYDITYNLDGGINHIDNISSYDIEDDTFSILNPTKEGYTFDAWYTNNEYTVLADTTIESGSFGDIELYAKWTANINDLVFDANTGEGSMTTLQAETDETITLPSNAFTKVDYVFVGWAITPTGEAIYLDQAEYTMGVLSEYTLYAVWGMAYTITFDKQEGYSGSDTIEAVVGMAMPSATAPSRSGYDFVGYYTEVSGGGVQYYDSSMNSMKNWDIEADTTLYALWEAKEYIITYHSNGGVQLDPQTKTVVYNSVIGELSVPVRVGYTFVEWNSLSNGEGTTFTSETIYAEINNISIYAIWSINQYTITFESNGGSVVSSITQDYNSVVSAPSDPTKDDFEFAGWYSDEEITEFYVFDRIPAENITLYADWGTEGLTYTPAGFGGSSYSVSKGSLPTGTLIDVVIPKRHLGVKVTEIGNQAFLNVFFRSVVIPDTILLIDDYAFYGCTLSSVQIPDGVMRIGILAFSGTEISSIIIPETVTVIEEYAFLNCNSLSSVIFEEGVFSIQKGVFENCTALTSVNLPSTIQYLGSNYGDYADAIFKGCTSLASVTVNALVPPTIEAESSTIFLNTSSSLVIYVPSASVDLYKTANGWSDYASIIVAIP